MGYNKIIIGGTTYIDLNDDTVEASKLAAGYTAHDKHGEVITGTNDYDMKTSEATAAAADILLGKTAGINGNLVTGSMPNNGGVTGTISGKDDEYAVAMGFHDGSGKVSLADSEKAKLIASNIKDGIELLGVLGEYTGEGVTAQTKNVTPTMSAQQILPDAGYDYLAEVNVAAIPVVETSNTNGTTVTIG